MKRIICIILCFLMLSSFLVLPSSARSFQITYYTEDVYAGGIIDMYVFVNGGVEPYTYQWQVDMGIGDGHWQDLEENDRYKGVKTDHLQLYTLVGNYSDWKVIPFRCVVTDAEGTVLSSPDIHADIFPTDKLLPNMKNWGYELYEPTISNTTGLKTTDYETYTAYTYAGSKLDMFIGSKPVEERAVLSNSEVELTREIHITENGRTTITGDRTNYIPYTVGANAVTAVFKLHATINGYDLGYLDTKTVKLSVSKPTAVSTATTSTDCSLLRHTYNESQKLASLPKGTALEVLAKDGSYYQVFYNNMVGYVGASLLNVKEPSYDPVIKDLDLIIDKPYAGQKPVQSCNVLTPGCELYKTDPVMWLDKETKEFLGPQETFREGRSYTLTIWLAAKDGYKFQTDASGNPKLTAAINGNLPPYIRKAYEQDPEKVVELAYDFNNVTQPPEEPVPPHVCAPVLKPRIEPSCTQPGHEAYYYCDCGMRYSDAQCQNAVDPSTWGSIPATGHRVSNWRTTQVYHYKVCTSCGEFLEQEDHRGGTVSCERQAICEVCQLPYGGYGSHPYDTKWTAIGAEGHAHMCTGKNCDAHDTVKPHDPGPAATDDKPQTCKTCNYIIEPAKNHTHKLSKVEQVPATCVKEGVKEHFACSGCSQLFSDDQGKTKATDLSIGALGHTTSEGWSWNEEFHWRTCSTCKTVLDETKLVHDMTDEVCATCGYKKGTELPPQETTAPTEEPTKAPDRQPEPVHREKKDTSWATALMLALVTFGASITATVILLKRKKR